MNTSLEAPISTQGLLYNKSQQICGYADDLNIMGRTVISVKECLLSLEETAKEVGLRINEDKTKMMVQNRQQRNRLGQNITMGECNFEVVRNFTYLGSIMTFDSDEVIEIRKRITTGNSAFYSLMPIMKSRNVHRKTKIKLYKTLIRTVATYGSESWTLTNKNADMLDIFERKILRKIYGPTNEDGIWRIRYNHELYQLYREPRLSEYIRLKRLKWAGHVQRMPDERVAKKALNGRPGGRRLVGKPRLRWEDAVSRDAQELLNTRSWRRASLDRDLWRRKIEEARTRFES